MRDDSNTLAIPIIRGTVLVDSCDAALVLSGRWVAVVKGDKTFAARYHSRGEGGGVTYLHRAILGTPAGRVAYHINGDGLDNRRCNLRDSRVDYKVDPLTGCWNWLKVKNENGYGRLTFGGRTFLAHRFYYERACGPVASDIDLDHLCRNPACVNPDHLEPVSHAENMRRGNTTRLTGEIAEQLRFIVAEKMAEGLTLHRSCAVVGDLVGLSAHTVEGIARGGTWRDAGGPISSPPDGRKFPRRNARRQPPMPFAPHPE
jgi:hypothetical protein